MDWYLILYLIVAAMLLWLTYQFVRHNKDTFSWSNFLKTSNTLGILALCLIAFIGFCIVLLRDGS